LLYAAYFVRTGLGVGAGHRRRTTAVLTSSSGSSPPRTLAHASMFFIYISITIVQIYAAVTHGSSLCRAPDSKVSAVHCLYLCQVQRAHPPSTFPNHTMKSTRSTVMLMLVVCAAILAGEQQQQQQQKQQKQRSTCSVRFAAILHCITHHCNLTTAPSLSRLPLQPVLMIVCG
jgi:hypothetical protein